MSVELSNFQKTNDTLNFDIKGCNSSLVNCLRRIIISEVKTCGFRTEEYEESDLKVIANTSSLHNEFLLHRIGLIPINIKNVNETDISKYKFILNVSNKSQEILDITTREIKVFNMDTGKDEDNQSFFPKNPITGDNILITRLKPTPDGAGEHIHIEGKCSRGVGKEHIRFSPVSKIVFINKVDPKVYETELKKYIAEHSNLSEVDAKHKFNIEESERHFYVDDNGDPNMFEFTLESVGVIPPESILLQGINQIVLKLKKFSAELEKTLKSNNSSVTIKETKSLMKAFDITIENETHTLGHLLQSHINKFNESKDIFVGYKNPHPLDKKIMIRLKVDDINQVKSILQDTVAKLTKICVNMEKDVSKHFKLSDAKKPKKMKLKLKPKGKGKGKADPDDGKEGGAPAP